MNMSYFELSAIQKRQHLDGTTIADFTTKIVQLDYTDHVALYKRLIEIVLKHDSLRIETIQLPEFELPLLKLVEPIDSIDAPSLGEWGSIGNIHFKITCEDIKRYKLELKIPVLFCDSYGINLLLKEISSTAFEKENEFGYQHFATWQNDRLKEIDLEECSFWQKHSQIYDNSSYPIRPNATSKEKFSYSRYILPNSSVIHTALQGLSRAIGFSEKECALILWIALLSKNTGNRKISIGLSSSGRIFDELNSLVGSMTCRIPFTVDIAETDLFKTLGESVRSSTDSLVEQLDAFDPVSNNGNLSPYEVGFTFNELNAENVEITHFETHDFSCNLDLNVLQTKNTSEISMAYNANLYTEESIEILSQQFELILTESLTKKDKPLALWKCITKEHSEISRIFNNPVTVSREKTVTERFEEIVAQYPDQIAVVDSYQNWSYQTLLNRSKEFALTLHESEGSAIAIYLDPSAAIPLTLLATLYAGKSYVPIAPGTPEKRLHYIIEDAKIDLIISERKYKNELANITGIVRFVDDPIMQSSNNLNSYSKPAESVYHIYTSGTTGMPKGVSISHNGLLNYTQWLSNKFNINNNHKSALLTSYAFDLGYTAFWGCLLNGATLFIPGEACISNPKHLLSYIQENELTFLKVTPGILDIWYAENPKGLSSCKKLSHIFSGGEAFDISGLKDFAKTNPTATLINHYGPTETTIGCVAKIFSAADLLGFSTNITIGKPIDNMRAILLNDNGEILPPGLEGQLFISGPGLASTYIGREDLWDEKCRTISSYPGIKWYDTGDRATWTPDGELIFQGRKDTELKVHGYRVNLTEIESILRKHPAISNAAIYQNIDQQNRLEALLIPTGNASAINRFCKIEKETDDQWHLLPDGGLLFEVNRAETQFMYDELCNDNVYFRNGIQINERDTIVDIGGNIGMFGLACLKQQKDLRLFSVEPSPQAFACLEKNSKIYSDNWSVFPVAIGATEGQCNLTIYKHHSLLNTLKPNTQEDQDLLLQLAIARYKDDLDAGSEEALRKITQTQLLAETVSCQMRTLSELMHTEKINRIDLLKIDVQRAELDVLNGISANDWTKIKQIVMEVQDDDGRLNTCMELLKNNGFEVTCQQENDFAKSDRYLIYARSKTKTSNKIDGKMNPAGGIVSYSPHQLSEELKSLLSAYLPEVHHPAVLHFTDELPLNKNGKIERAKLSTHPSTIFASDKTQPSSPIDIEIAEIWETVLNVNRVYLEDNFFDLGGHSLKSVHIINQIRIRFDADLSMADLLRNPSFRNFSAVVVSKLIDQKKSGEMDENLFSIPLLPMQKQIWFLTQLDNASTAYNMIRAVAINGSVHIESLEIALRGLITKHEALRTVFEPGKVIKQKILAVDAALEKFQLSLKNVLPEIFTNELNSHIETEKSKPFRLESNLPFRATLLTSTTNDAALILASHHIVCDGVSFEIILADLWEFYAKEIKGNLIPIISTVSYRKSIWAIQDRIQQQHIASIAYWTDNFSRKWEELNLPIDRERPNELNFKGEQHTVQLPQLMNEKIEQIALDCGVSTYVLSVAILKVLLKHWTGSSEITIGSTVSGRDLELVEKQVGYFANTVVLRDFLEETTPFPTFLSAIADTVLNAIQFPFIELEHIVDQSELIRRNGVAVLFDVGFTWYMHESAQDPNVLLEPYNLTINALTISDPPARSDLWFFAHKQEGILTWDIIYNKSLFEPKTIKDLGELLLKIFDEIIKNPKKPLSDYLNNRSIVQENINPNYELNL
jgi:amino acid adenylation domain-containing protein/FkbM family methyltransferase